MRIRNLKSYFYASLALPSRDIEILIARVDILGRLDIPYISMRRLDLGSRCLTRMILNACHHIKLHKV